MKILKLKDSEQLEALHSEACTVFMQAGEAVNNLGGTLEYNKDVFIKTHQAFKQLLDVILLKFGTAHKESSDIAYLLDLVVTRTSLASAVENDLIERADIITRWKDLNESVVGADLRLGQLKLLHRCFKKLDQAFVTYTRSKGELNNKELCSNSSTLLNSNTSSEVNNKNTKIPRFDGKEQLNVVYSRAHAMLAQAENAMSLLEEDDVYLDVACIETHHALQYLLDSILFCFIPQHEASSDIKCLIRMVDTYTPVAFAYHDNLVKIADTITAWRDCYKYTARVGDLVGDSLLRLKQAHRAFRDLDEAFRVYVTSSHYCHQFNRWYCSKRKVIVI